MNTSEPKHETDHSRVSEGLPSAEALCTFVISREIISAHRNNVIKDSDVEPNVANLLRQEFPSTAVPPLNVHERVARNSIIHALAQTISDRYMEMRHA